MPRYPKTISLNEVEEEQTQIVQEAHKVSVIDIYRAGLAYFAEKPVTSMKGETPCKTNQPET